MRLGRGVVALVLCAILAGCALRPVRSCADHPLLCGGLMIGVVGGVALVTDGASP